MNMPAAGTHSAAIISFDLRCVCYSLQRRTEVKMCIGDGRNP